MSASSPVRLEYDESIARIIFDQPDSRANVLSSATWLALGAAIAEVAQRTDVIGLLLMSAKEGMFLAGADLKELAALPTEDTAPARQIVRNGLQVLTALESLLIPTAAAIDGACLGGGLEVALACDYRLGGSHPKIKIGLPETKLALIPGWGGTQRLPRLIGAARAGELLVTGRALAANEALEVGVIDRLTDSTTLVADAQEVLIDAPSEDWDSRRARRLSPYFDPVDFDPARELTSTLGSDESVAAQAAIRAMENGLPLSLTPALDCESNEFVKLLLAPAGRQRIAAFLQR